MVWGYDGGVAWLWMTAMLLIFWGGVAALIVFAVRAFSARGDGDQAVDLLRRRLARGEITEEEFERTRRVLQG